MEIEISTVKT